MLTALLLVLAFAVPAQAGPGESDFTSRINSARRSRGIAAYGVRSDLAYVARRHAERMAAQRRIYHNPNLSSQVSGWRSIGENVGKGSDVSAIHNAFMSSSSHRANILSTTFREVGVGTAVGSDGLLYVAQVFRQPTRASAGPAPAPAPTATRTTRQARTSTRATRSGRRTPVAVRPAAPAPPRVHPAVLLRGRLQRAFAYYGRARVDGLLPDLVTYHWTIRTIAG